MSVLPVEPLTEFFDAIRSPLTKDRYEKRLDLFFKHLSIGGSTLRERAKTFASKARDIQWATSVINDYMRHQKERAEKGEISESTVPNFFKPIKLFCEMNDVALNWKKISKRIPRGRQYGRDRAPTKEEIKAILSYPDRRIKSAVLSMSSSGIRIGAFDFLDWGHVEPLKKEGEIQAAKVKVYAGTDEEYTTFMTPETFHVLEEYVQYRKSQGEKIDASSPMIRDLFHPDRGGQGEPHLPKRLKSSGVKRLVEDALKAAGLRKLQPGRRRHEFQANHGFRKWFKSVCEKNMKTLHVEMLLGHDTGLNMNYYRPSEKELLEEYQKAVPDLTIIEEAKAPPEMHDVRERLTRLESLNKALTKEVGERDSKIESMIKDMAKLKEKAEVYDQILNRLAEEAQEA